VFHYRVLTDERDVNLYTAFTKAFSDYQVNINLPLEVFQRMLTRRGYLPEISCGAYENDELIGFILNGMRSWNNKITAYDTGTGVIPIHRKKGITKKLFASTKEILLQNNVEQYLLEVLQANQVAADLYLKEGFKIARAFNCYQADKAGIHKVNSCEAVINSMEFDVVNWDQLQGFWEFIPSWQNSVDSIRCSKDSLHITTAWFENNIVGYGIIEINTGDVPQLAVAKEFRNKGIGCEIIKELVSHTKSDHLRFINIEDGCETLNTFLKNNGFIEIGKQYEMVLPLEL